MPSACSSSHTAPTERYASVAGQTTASRVRSERSQRHPARAARASVTTTQGAASATLIGGCSSCKEMAAASEATLAPRTQNEPTQGCSARAGTTTKSSPRASSPSMSPVIRSEEPQLGSHLGGERHDHGEVEVAGGGLDGAAALVGQLPYERRDQRADGDEPAGQQQREAGDRDERRE